MLVEPILGSMPAIKGVGRGHPRRRPTKLPATRAYDVPRVRRYLRRRGAARIARIARDSSARLGGHRWVVERTLGWPSITLARAAGRAHWIANSRRNDSRPCRCGGTGADPEPTAQFTVAGGYAVAGAATILRSTQFVDRPYVGRYVR